MARLVPISSPSRRCRGVLLLALVACSAEPTVVTLSVPPREGFSPVSAALGMRCGSLDCHGRTEQNMRLYGELGLRLDPNDVPAGDETTALEHEQNHVSVVSLEPELLAAVFRDGGERSERLSLVRKARGSEQHEGGVVFAAGDAGDLCLLSWLSGDVDAAACEQAAELPASPFEP